MHQVTPRVMLFSGLIPQASGFGTVFYVGTGVRGTKISRNNSRGVISSVALRSSPFGDIFDSLFGNEGDNDESKSIGSREKSSPETPSSDDEDETLSLSSFQQELINRQAAVESDSEQSEDDENLGQPGDGGDIKEFDGYDLRDAIFEKYSECYDVEFQRVDSYGFRTVYLNIMPFKLGRRPFRHETEFDYLCHLQAVVEILQKYNQLDYILAQLSETKKKPRPGTSPLVAVPLRLDLTQEQVDKILG